MIIGFRDFDYDLKIVHIFKVYELLITCNNPASHHKGRNIGTLAC